MTNTTKIIKKVIPAVVSIIVSKKLQEVEKELPAELFSLLPFGMPEKLLRDNADARGMIQISGGSGFIADPKGIILTNKHVISDPSAEYTIISSDGKKYIAEVVARDPLNDIAILKINDHNKTFPAIKLGDSSKLELGESVLAIGNALGLFQNTVSSGIISGLSRAIATFQESAAAMQELRGLIQTDAAINPGNSGGPLINMKGEAIAINAAIVPDAQNIGFAIPINYAKRDLDDIKKYGNVRRPILGLRYVNIDKNFKEKFGLASEYGALVAGKGEPLQGVIPGTPAAEAGIKEGDIILECNGEKLTTSKTIQDFLEELNVGDILKMKVLRGKKEFEFKAKLKERK